MDDRDPIDDLIAGGAPDAVPEALKLRMQAELPARRRSLAWAGVLAAAAAVVVGVWLARPEAVLPAYELAGPFGGVVPTRGDAQRGTYHLPHSRLELVARPRATLSGMAPVARAFVSMPGAALRSLPAASLSRAESGAWTVSGAASEILGDAPGTFIVHLALARSAADLAALDGRPLTEVGRNIQILSATIVYRLTPPEESP